MISVNRENEELVAPLGFVGFVEVAAHFIRRV
jgi:hypothetical protein